MLSTQLCVVLCDYTGTHSPSFSTIYRSRTHKAAATAMPRDKSPQQQAGTQSEPTSYVFTFPLLLKSFLVSSGQHSHPTRIKGLLAL